MRLVSLILISLLLVVEPGCKRKKPKSHGASSAPTAVQSSIEVKTADGWRIAIYRYLPPDGVRRFREPILLTPGFVTNSRIYDFDDRRSLAKFLALQGYEVWSYDFRGTGKSDTPGLGLGQLLAWDFQIEHYLQFDTAAVIEVMLRESRSQQFFWLSHGMGSTLAYGHLAMTNDSRVRGLITVGGIGAMDPQQKVDDLIGDFFLGLGLKANPYMPVNMPFPVRWAIDTLFGDNVKVLAAISYLLDSPAGKLMWNSNNMNAQTIGDVLRTVLSNTSTNVYKRMFEWIERSECFLREPSPPTPSLSVSWDPNAPQDKVKLYAGFGQFFFTLGGAEPPPAPQEYSVTKNLAGIQTPMLQLVGGADLFVPLEKGRQIYETVSSHDKTFRLCSALDGLNTDYGHLDMLVGVTAPEEIYPLISEWVGERATRE